MNIFEILEQELPLMVPRPQFDKLVAPHFGGSLNSGYLAKLDAKGQGPKTLQIGKKVFYPKEALLEWLKSKMN